MIRFLVSPRVGFRATCNFRALVPGSGSPCVEPGDQRASPCQTLWYGSWWMDRSCGGRVGNQVGVATQVQSGAAVGAKNEARFPGRVPHVRQSVHGPKKTGAAPPTLLLREQETTTKSLRPRARTVVYSVKALEKSVFSPCTPHGKPGRVGRTWSTRPEPRPWAVQQVTLLAKTPSCSYISNNRTKRCDHG